MEKPKLPLPPNRPDNHNLHSGRRVIFLPLDSLLIPGLDADMSKPKYALLIAEEPRRAPTARDDPWKDFHSALEHLTKPVHTKRFAHGVWQIPLDSDLVYLGELLTAGARSKISMRVLFLKKDPDWVTYAPETATGATHS
jgi:hypothetical protein